MSKPCAVDGCPKQTTGVFEFCIPHWYRLKELKAAGDESFVTRFTHKRGTVGWATQVRACVAAILRDEGRATDADDTESEMIE